MCIVKLIIAVLDFQIKVIVRGVDILFKRKKSNLEKLLDFGFVKNNDCFTYTKVIMDEKMQIIVKITCDDIVNVKVIDNLLGEEYVLHNQLDATGAFVGAVRSEYENVLAEIAANCFEPDVFKSDCAKAVMQYIRQTYQDELEYLWLRTPDNAIVRRKDNRKWYGAILTVPKQKLGLESSETVEILNLKVQIEDSASIIDGQRYFPGYHMNKNHWISICLDGSVGVEEIFERIDVSYKLAGK